MFHFVRVGVVSVGVLVMMIGASGERVAAQSNPVPNPYQSILDWAKLPQGRIWGQMAALDIDSHGNVWAVERCGGTTCNGRPEAPVLGFGPSGDVVKSLGAGLFVFPHGIAIDDDDNLWITDGRAADGKGHQVIKFNPDGEIVMRLGTAGVAGEGPDTFNGPSAVAIAPNGDIFVGDGHDAGTNARVVKFSKDGTFIKAWGQKGVGPGEFATPHSLAFDSRGRLFVGDRENNRIQLFTQDGTFLEEWTQFGRPSGMWIDSNDVIYVADSQSNMARNPGFTRGLSIGSARDGSVAAFIPHPNPDPTSPAAEGVVIDAAGNVYTAGNDEPVAKHVPIESSGALAQAAPSFNFDPTWPKTLPNLWKMGGVTGLAVDSNDNVWVYNRPNDATATELRAEPTPPIALCCARPPSMIHIDKSGNVIGSFDAPQGHGMDVDDDGFVYLGQDTVRKYDPRTGELVAEVARTPERENGAPVGLAPPVARAPGQPTSGAQAPTLSPAERAAAVAAFRIKYPPETPIIVGGLEEIRIVEQDDEMYVADNYLGGRVLVFDLDTFEFKRGWGAYGRPLAEISIDDADHEYMPNGPMPRDFAGHLTLNVSDDGLVYAADRNANRIHVTTKDGQFLKEFILAPSTGAGGATGGVAFSPDPEQQFLYISDLTNNTLWFLDRDNGELVAQMGNMGDGGGEFYGLHMISVDSQGNIYTGEVQQGERVQRFVPSNSPKGRLLQQLADMP